MMLQLKRRISTLCLSCVVSAVMAPTQQSNYFAEQPRLLGARSATTALDVAGDTRRASSLESPAPLKMAGQAASQPSDANSWEMLPTMHAGVKLRLVLTDGSEVVGHLVVARSDAVVLDRNKVRKGPYTAPAGMTLRDPLTFQRTQVASVEEAKGWPAWAKVVLWVGIGWVVAGVIIGSVVGNS